MFARLLKHLGRLHVRLLLVNAVVLLVPVAGLEFARLFETELLRSLERDIRNQAVLVRHFLERSQPDTEANEAVLRHAARDTRTRVRVVDPTGTVLLDSHRFGPPEGEEEPPPRTFGVTSRLEHSPARWAPIAERPEVRAALAGRPSAYTRIREREPSVILFVTEPIVKNREVGGVVYVTRSTRPVMVELYRIRGGLQKVLLLALAFTVGVTLWLAYSITHPLASLSRIATRIAGGETNLEIPVRGTGEIRELALAFQTMTNRLRQRMQDTAAFAADVAHGFKSPLTSIRGAAELLREGAAEDPTARRRFLANIELDSERLDRLVSRLLQLSRIEASNEATTRLELGPLLRQVAERSSTPDVHIAVDAPDGVFLCGRKSDLATALANLMDNAVRFSPSGSEVRVELTVERDHAIVRVKDEGPGVAEEVESRLFERFFTTDADHGTGLGLPIVQSVAEAHGGSVHLERNRVGTGACFVMILPGSILAPVSIARGG